MGEGRVIRRLSGIADQVNALEDGFVALSDAELREETDRFRARLADGETLDDLLPEAFAAVREAAKRTLGQRHFDVQLMGGAALHQGNIAEMKTGEGKTLVATLPAYLNALAGKGVHVVTVNDYLASYQSDLMGRVHRFLGLTTGCILAGQTPEERREEYAADITYGTNNEFGFDYLRDNMAWRPEDLVQRGHHYAIIDEVDSILIDEARTPLIISGPASGDANKWYAEFAKLVLRLKREDDYEVDEKKRTVGVLETGIAKVEDYLGIDNLYESLNTPLIGFLNNAIKAKELFTRDKDYVVMGGEVLIVDEHTGRMLAGPALQRGHAPGHRGQGGCGDQGREPDPGHDHPAELLPALRQARRDDRHRPDRGGRVDEHLQAGRGADPDQHADDPRSTSRTSSTRTRTPSSSPWSSDIVERHAKGQPVLVGTVSVEKSEHLSKLLRKQGVPHDVLNAKQHAPGGDDRRPGRPQGRGHRRDQHGRARHRHHARWQRRVHGRGRDGPARPGPGRAARGVRGPVARGARRDPGGRSRPSTRRSSSWAGCTCWAPSATSRAGSTTSCAAGRAARATRASPASTCR